MTNEEATGVLDQQQPAAPAADTRSPAATAPGAAQKAVATGGAPQAPGSQVAETADGDAKNLDMLLDVNLRLTVELGRARLKFRDVLNLSSGSIIELSKQISEPVDILVNDSQLATGEVVVVDDHFAVRITNLLNRVEKL